jgi:DNA-binding CsgD family transcriptional regulator
LILINVELVNYALMNENPKFQKIYQFKLLFDQFLNKLENPSQDDIDFHVNKIKEIEDLTTDSNRYYVLWDQSKFAPLYVCKAFERECGFSAEYIKSQGIKLIYKIIDFKQISTLLKLHIWGAKSVNFIQDSPDPTSTQISIFGLKSKDKWGRWRTLMFSQKLLKFDKNGTAILSLLTISEITHIHNSNVIWYRVLTNTDIGRRSKIFFENSTKKEANDLFTYRELEILKLSAEKYTVSDIGKRLGISKNTVERHRKNMIAKCGVSSITGAIYISKILNLL